MKVVQVQDPPAEEWAVVKHPGEEERWAAVQVGGWHREAPGHLGWWHTQLLAQESLDRYIAWMEKQP